MSMMPRHRLLSAVLVAVFGMTGCAGVLSGRQSVSETPQPPDVLAGRDGQAQSSGQAQSTAQPQPVVVSDSRSVSSQSTGAGSTATIAAPSPTPPQALAPAQPNSTLAELQGLIQQRQVNEMRTVYNGSYGASLLFHPDTLTYFVALFQQKDFWRVVKTQDYTQAEELYQRFGNETRALADEELRGVRLQAEYAHLARQLEKRAMELATLQTDLQTQQQQESVVAARRQQAKAQAEQLAQQQREARRQLQALQRQIKQLEEQQAALGIPAKPASANRQRDEGPLPPK